MIALIEQSGLVQEMFFSSTRPLSDPPCAKELDQIGTPWLAVSIPPRMGAGGDPYCGALAHPHSSGQNPWKSVFPVSSTPFPSTPFLL
jgi:hypothetical protein